MARVEDLPSVMTGADGTNAGTSGLVPAPAATDNNKFLSGDGTWKTVVGGVTSVNGQTGAVTLSAADVDAVPQVASLPTASASYENAIIQSRTSGYFYKCESDGQDPATYTWTQIDVQPPSTTITVTMEP